MGWLFKPKNEPVREIRSHNLTDSIRDTSTVIGLLSTGYRRLEEKAKLKNAEAEQFKAALPHVKDAITSLQKALSLLSA
jgi:hypothetical protein